MHSSLAFASACLVTVLALPARAESPAPAPKAEDKSAAPADKPAEEAEAPKESPLPIAMFMAGAGVGTAVVGAYLTFATDDLGSNRLGVPLMIGGALGAGAGVALIVIHSKEPAKSGAKRRPVHTVSVGPLSAGYSYSF